MRSINKTDIEIGSSDISISIYSAIESEVHLKRISGCCNSAVKMQNVCETCNKVLEWADIKKGIDLGTEIKEVNADNLKLENTNLKILGLIEDDIENSVFYDGDVWFIGSQEDKKNKSKTERNNIKFAYLREAIRGNTLIGLINVRGKEHIVLLKPYFNGIVGQGIYHFDRIRDIKEISNYSFNADVNQETIKQMKEVIGQKEKIALKNIENKRAKLLEAEIEAKEVISNENVKSPKQENVLELVNF